MAARKNRGTKDRPMQKEWRDKIRASALINRLYDCGMGEVELNPQQIKAIDIILKKIEPDLARIEQQMLDKNGEKADASVEVRFVKTDKD
jgi:hypothetical protein